MLHSFFVQLVTQASELTAIYQRITYNESMLDLGG